MTLNPDFNKYREDPLGIRQESDYILDSITLTSFNGKSYEIRDMQIEFSIYEDMYAHFMYGEIHMRDSVDLPRYMPIIGEEIITFTFTRPSENSGYETSARLPTYKMKFRVNKMDERSKPNMKTQDYILRFISPEFLSAQKASIHKSYKDMLYSEMVDKIYGEFIKKDKDIEIETTKYKQNFVVSNLKPFQAVEALAGRCISKENEHSNYVFFEDMEKFHFVTVASLIEKDWTQKYYHQPANFKNDGDAKNRELYKDMYNTNFYKHNGAFNIIENTNGGMYGSRHITFDPVREEYDVIDFDYKEKFDSFVHTDKNDVCTDELEVLKSPKAMIKLTGTNKDHDKIAWIAAKEPGIKPTHIEEQLLPRISLFRQINNHTILVDSPGDPRRHVGQTIFYDLPAVMGKISKEWPQKPDKYLFGKYLVTVVKHKFALNKYTTEMQLVKDSFFKEIEHVDPVSAYKDVY